MLKEILVRVLRSRSEGVPYVHTKGRKVQVLVGWEAVEVHGCKGKANGSRGTGGRAVEVSSDFKPLTKHRE